MKADVLITCATLLDGGEPVDVAILGPQIIAVESSLRIEAREHIDLRGDLLLPAFADPHLHVDKALTRPASGPPLSLTDAIVRWRAIKAKHTGVELLHRGRRLLDKILRFGTTAARSHADVDEVVGLGAVETLLALRQEYAGRLTLQVVAYCSSLATPRKPSDLRLLEESLGMGADVVGGVPNFDQDPRAYIDLLLDLARRYGRPVDLHIDEGRPEAGVWVEYLADRILEGAFTGAVAASHCCALSLLPDRDAERIIEKLCTAGISVIACPATNLFLQDADRRDPVWRGLTRVRSLRDAGITVAIGSDNIRDLYYPYGQGNMLETAFLMALGGRFGSADMQAVLAMASSEAAKILGIHEWGLVPGRRADLVAFPKDADLLADRPAPTLILAQGTLILQPS